MDGADDGGDVLLKWIIQAQQMMMSLGQMSSSQCFGLIASALVFVFIFTVGDIKYNCLSYSI